jgi:hypothetical protein
MLSMGAFKEIRLCGRRERQNESDVTGRDVLPALDVEAGR